MEKNENKTFLRVWDYLIEDNNLDPYEILLMSKILSFTDAGLSCYISNDEVRNLLRLKNNETASRRLSKLQKNGYITMYYAPHPSNSKKTIRYIVPTYGVDSKVKGGLTQESRGIDSKVKGGLTQESINNIIDNNINKNIYNTSYTSTSILGEIDKKIYDDEIKYILTQLIGNYSLTSKQKEKIIDNKSQLIKKIPDLEEILYNLN